jgi:putative transposase
MFRSRWHKFLCRDILNQIAKRHSMKILSLGIADDHIHLVATLHPSFSPIKAFQVVKGASSYAFFRAVPNFRKRYPRGEFWARSGTFRSIGDVDKNTVMEYSERHNQSTLSDFVYHRKSAGL